ncbi:flap endonuclease GEN homolog 1-like [Dreissena polymorpha]|uniref:Uncharacterized protein n=1 Tax=Dreissena polymorpha TaxID=45954 RepID=A0A9D4K4Z9_DREPO|nr:flap endonuclease GEN homolog 1-like [Dreissena polymorpha]KAH3833037.1 hypothetical protein DPMN_106339 [Dreissena polymorpha]
MGVHGLWEILSPASEVSVPLTTLRGQTVAVDLSAWIMQSTGVAAPPGKHYLMIRSLFYRTTSLLGMGVKLVFVLDGRAPDIKEAALLDRQEAQTGSTASVNLDRPGLKVANSQCVEMLQCLGVPCIQSPGEAEAMCAYLNKAGLVDGCFTEDGDFFLYGGKTLYKNIQKNGKADKYTDVSIANKLGLGQNDLLALGLLLGCDYDKEGVRGVGTKKGLDLVKHFKDKGLDALDRLKGWAANKTLDELEQRLATPVKANSHCTLCSHLGKSTSHTRLGCTVCETDTGCQPGSKLCPCHACLNKLIEHENKLELTIRRKALDMKPAFPNIEIVQEFTMGTRTCMVTSSALELSNIHFENLIKCLNSTLRWDRAEALENIVPFLIQYEMHRNGNEGKMFSPTRIVRKCKVNHTSCLEVEWDKTDVNTWAGESHATGVKVKVTRELLTLRYPALVEKYEEDQVKRPPKGSRKGKITAEIPGQTTLHQFFAIKKKKLDFSS